MSGRTVSRGLLVALLAAVVGLPMLEPGGLVAQEEQPQRKVKTRVQPAYPELAKRMNLSGTVKIEVVVSPAGTLKTQRPVGGNPVLMEAAQNALKGWRWEPGPTETIEVLQFHFAL